MVAHSKEINGIKLYYEYDHHESSTKTLVLIHGFLSSTFSFRRLTPLLRKEFNVLNVDFPPFGKSGKSKKYIYSYQNIAKTMIMLFESLDLEKVTLVGHSMGGQVCLTITSQRPDLVENMILLSCSGYLKPAKPLLRLSSFLPFFHVIVKKWLAKSGLMRNLQNVVYNHQLIDEEMMRGYMEPFLDEEIFHGLSRLIRHREEDLSSDDLKKLNTPSLLIWGEHDRVVPLSVGRRLHQDLQSSKLVVLKETGHLVPEEHPLEVYDYLKSFLNQKSYG
jgi:pimeloyl-ACP methyl ester carboxylesterase